MGSKDEKIQNSEFDQKLRSSRLAKENLTDGDLRNDDTHADRHEANRATDHTERMPIIEERIKVDKKIVETGKVRIGKHLEEEEVTLDIPTVHEEVDIERVEINQYVDDVPPAVRHEGDTMIVPVLKEVSVVVKKLLLVEELHITKRKVETHKEQKVTLRKEILDVHRVANDDIRIDSGDRTSEATRGNP